MQPYGNRNKRRKAKNFSPFVLFLQPVIRQLVLHMKKSLIALAFGTLALGMSEFVMMGILPDIARSLGVSIPEAGYHYIQNPKSLCHTQIDLRGIVENKTQIFQLFKEVYTRLGLYEELQPQIYKFLFAFSESGVPSDSLQGALLDAMSRLNDASVQPEPSRKKPRRKPQKHARRKKPRHKEE